MPRTSAAANATALPNETSERQIMLAYLEWLWNEQIAVCRSIGYTQGIYAPIGTPVRQFHHPLDGAPEPLPPATRASAVMLAAGVDMSTVRRWARKEAASQIAMAEKEVHQ